MPDLADGESTEMKGSAKDPYIVKNTGGVYSCSCPAWRNQSVAIEKRTCKHIRKLRGDDAETERIGSALPVRKTSASGDSEGPPVLLAEKWENDIDLEGWWMSEKLDGVRAYWDGKKFLSRLGNEFMAPDWFIDGFPNTPLDGELWLGRGEFQRTVSIVRRQDRSEHWKEISYVVFDAPALKGPFEERLEYLADALGNHTPSANALEHVVCEGLDHLQNELSRVESLGGEGLMLREPGSKYVAGRSSTLLKVKTFHDAEAIVVDYVPGKGRHKGRCGALRVEMPDGTRFSVGTGLSDAQRENPPAVDAVITYRYQELTKDGVPRFPSYVGERIDAEFKSVAKKKSVTKKKSPKKASAKPVAGTTASTDVRYFEFTDDKSSKFWEISIDGTDVTVRYGRLGASGQIKTKSFDEVAPAEAHASKLIDQKTGKGYIETDR